MAALILDYLNKSETNRRTDTLAQISSGKYMQPEVREFAKAVLTLHTMHETAKTTRGRETDGQQYNPAIFYEDQNTPDPHATRLSIMENISRGVYDEVAKMLDKLDESDLLDLIDQMKEKVASKK